MTGNQYREPPSAAIKFPVASDLVNFTKGSREVSEVNVLPSLVQERMAERDDNGECAAGHCDNIQHGCNELSHYNNTTFKLAVLCPN